MIVYSTAYDDILKADFNEKIDVADEFLSTILSNKLVITPFISVQRDFGYSDVTKNNNNNGIITQHFERAIHKQKAYQRIFNKYGLNRHIKHEANTASLHPYLASAIEPKLHIGCGKCIKPEWLNVDISPVEGAEYMDAGSFSFSPTAAFNIFILNILWSI